MIQRFLSILRRRPAEQQPFHSPRPNALSREVARAERLRRDALRAEAVARQSTIPPQGERTRHDQQLLPTTRRVRSTPLAASLRSRSELRRALLLNEILGQPAALRRPRNGDPDR